LLVAGQASKDDMGAVVVKHHAPETVRQECR
jgi:hypothetical protein